MKTNKITLLAALLVVLAGCGETSSDPLAGTNRNYALSPADGSVVVRVVKDGYQLGSSNSVLSESELREGLKRALPASNRTVDVRLFPGVLPYYAIVAIHAAAEIGYSQAIGIANYTDDWSEQSRKNWVLNPPRSLIQLAARIEAEKGITDH